MADRYWVGGTGSWSSTNTANWSTSSGGAGGASVPTAADNVFFDAGSDSGGAFVVTLTIAPRVCKDLTIASLNFGMTLAGTIGLTVSGSLSFPATNFTRTYTGITTFNATTTGQTITTNGVVFGDAVTFNGVGGEWTLGSAFSCGTYTLTVTSGTFDTSSVGNYSVTARAISSNTTSTRTINLNASTITLSISNGTAIAFGGSNLTFDAGTSQINLTGTPSVTLAGFNKTFYDVAFTSTTYNTGSITITGNNTFNNLSFACVGSGVQYVTFSANQTINGTLTATGTGVGTRIFLKSSIVGSSRTLACAAIAAMSDTDFRDITIAGAHGTLSGTRLGNCGGNSNITFAAGVNKYWNLATGGSWTNAAWALSSGGTVSSSNFPLAQDTVIIENTGLNTGATIYLNNRFNIGDFDSSTRTNSFTFNTLTNSPQIHGYFVYGSGASISGTGSFYFCNSSTKTLDSGGKTFTQSVYVECASTGGIQLVTNNLTIPSNRFIYLNGGNLDLNDLSLTAGSMYQANAQASIAFGTTGAILLNQSTAGGYVLYNTVYIPYTGTYSITIAPTQSSSYVFFYAVNGTGQPFTFSGTRYIILQGYYLGGADFSAFTGIIELGANVYFTDNVTLSSGMTMGQGSLTYRLGFYNSYAYPLTITSNGKNIRMRLLFYFGEWQLQDALTVSSLSGGTASAVELYSGTIDLNNFTLTTPSFSILSTATCAIAFGTGNITCTGPYSGYSVWYTSTAQYFSYTGTPTVNISSTLTAGNTLYCTFFGYTTSAAFSIVNFNITSGSYGLYFQNTGTGYLGGANFTGYSGNMILAGYAVVQGDLLFSTLMTIFSLGNYMTIYVPSGETVNITSNGRVLPSNFALYFSYRTGATNTTVRLLDALGSNATVYHVAGTLDLNGYTLTVASFQMSSSASDLNITFNSGGITVTGSGGLAFSNSTTTLTTTEGTGAGTISMTSLGAKTFVGGSATYACTLNQGGTGTLTVSGSNEFSGMSNTAIGGVLFTGGTTNTFSSSFSLNGTSGNFLTLSATSGSQAILKKPSSWLMGVASVDSGNNTGLTFSSGDGTMDYLNVSYIDGQVFGTIYNVTISESSTASEFMEAYRLLLANISEITTASDTVETTQTFRPNINETATAADNVISLAEFYAAAAEQAAASDTVGTTQDFVASIAEQVNASQTASAIQTFQTNISETANATDTAAVAQGFNSQISETAATADQYAVAASVFNPAVSETAQVSDAPASNYSVNSAVSETANASDAASAKAIFLASLIELVTATDTVAAAQTFATTVSESGVASEVVAAAQLFASLIAEGIASQDSVSAARTIGVAVTELATAEDFAAASQIFNNYVGESGVASDEVDAPGSIYNAVTAVAVAVSDPTSTNATFNAAVQESLTVADLLFARYLWELINDNQVANWQNINNVQSAGWSDIDDAQTPGWNNIPTQN
jgi:hypothetical protein